MTGTDFQLRLQNVSCDLGGTRILHDISFALHRGTITVVLGASGAGKSTLLRAIAGFEPIGGGEISASSGIFSSPDKTLPPEQRRIGIVVQSHALFPHMSASKNIRFGLNGSGSKEAARRWLERVGLGHRADAYPHELSGGEQQRVALARALAREPDVVLLDEAFSSLDQQLRKSVRRDAKQLLKETDAAVLAVTHDPDEAMELADTIVVLDQGRILQTGGAQELYWRPESVTAARLLGDVNEVPGRWQDGQFNTAFGAIVPDSNRQLDASIALVRPSSIKVAADKDSSLEITELEFSGGYNSVTIRAENGQTLQVSGVLTEELGIGSHLRVTFDTNRIGWAGQVPRSV